MQTRKYKNQPTYHDDILFHSKKEGRRYLELKILLRIGAIADLKLQPKYPIFINKIKVCTYVGDFEYLTEGKIVCEDVKGFFTPLSKLKVKMFKASYPDILLN